MSCRLITWFLYSSAVFLFFAAAVFLFFAISGGRMLELPDALLGISNRQVFYMLSFLLFSISVFLLVNRNIQLRLGLLTWLSFNLQVYHFGVAYNTSANLLAFLGNLSPLIPISPRANFVLVSVLLFALFVSSSSLLMTDWLMRRKSMKQSKPLRSVAGKLEPIAVK